MKYPVKMEKSTWSFTPGKWYRCCISQNKFFNEGFCYLCVQKNRNNSIFEQIEGTFLVGSGGLILPVSDITATFEEVNT